jgi:hypothetical protein
VDFIAEFLIQLLVQIIIELLWEVLLEGLFHGLGEVLVRRTARFVLGALVGLGFGWQWGHHLTGGSSWPKLLWVSLVLGVAALALAVGRAGSPAEPSRSGDQQSGWAALVAVPWRWSVERLVGFAIINAGIAVGIVASFHRAGLG